MREREREKARKEGCDASRRGLHGETIVMRVEERERERERSVASRGSCSMYVFCSASPLVSSLSCHQFLFLSLYLFLRPSRFAAPLRGSPPRARCVHAPARGGEHGQAAYMSHQLVYHKGGAAPHDAQNSAQN